VSAAGQQGAGGQPRQTLSLFDAVTMIVGLIVGAGIFGTPSAKAC
jgi:amino acid permease